LIAHAVSGQGATHGLPEAAVIVLNATLVGQMAANARISKCILVFGRDRLRAHHRHLATVTT
jgi:hypothetical protein